MKGCWFRSFPFLLILIFTNCSFPNENVLCDENSLIIKSPQKVKVISRDSIEFFMGANDEFVDSLFVFKVVKYLNISCHESNCLTRLPIEISRFRNLETLILSKTSIKVLPSEILNLKELKKLIVVGGGELAKLPSEIGSLENLEEINLWRNQLTDLPPSVFKLKNLKRINLGQNSFGKDKLNYYKRKFNGVNVLFEKHDLK